DYYRKEPPELAKVIAAIGAIPNDENVDSSNLIGCTPALASSSPTKRRTLSGRYSVTLVRRINQTTQRRALINAQIGGPLLGGCSPLQSRKLRLDPCDCRFGFRLQSSCFVQLFQDAKALKRAVVQSVKLGRPKLDNSTERKV